MSQVNISSCFQHLVGDNHVQIGIKCHTLDEGEIEMILVDLTTEHGEGLALQQHGFLVYVTEQFQGAALHACTTNNHVCQRFHTQLTRDFIQNYMHMAPQTVQKCLLTHEVFKHRLLMGQQVINNRLPTTVKKSNITHIDDDLMMISKFKPKVLHAGAFYLGAQEAVMVKKRGSMKSSKTSFFQALLV